MTQTFSFSTDSVSHTCTLESLCLDFTTDQKLIVQRDKIINVAKYSSKISYITKLRVKLHVQGEDQLKKVLTLVYFSLLAPPSTGLLSPPCGSICILHPKTRSVYTSVVRSWLIVLVVCDDETCSMFRNLFALLKVRTRAGVMGAPRVKVFLFFLIALLSLNVRSLFWMTGLLFSFTSFMTQFCWLVIGQ